MSSIFTFHIGKLPPFNLSYFNTYVLMLLNTYDNIMSNFIKMSSMFVSHIGKLPLFNLSNINSFVIILLNPHVKLVIIQPLQIPH
jgi:hypothetical protein